MSAPFAETDAKPDDAVTHGRKKLIIPTTLAIAAMIFLIENDALFIGCGMVVGLMGDIIGCGSGDAGNVGGIGCTIGCGMGWFVGAGCCMGVGSTGGAEGLAIG